MIQKGPDSVSGHFWAIRTVQEIYTWARTASSLTTLAVCVPVMSNTMRPSIVPACIRLKISLMSSSFSALVVAWTRPSPAKESASARIQTCAHDGAANGQSLQHHFKRWAEGTIREEAVQSDGSASARHADGLCKCTGGRSRHEDRLGSADLLLEERCGVLLFGVHGELAPSLRASASSLFRHVHSRNTEAHRLAY